MVAVDETPAAQFALRHVVPHALDQRSQLTLLTVVPNRSGAVIAAAVSPKRLAEEMEREAGTRVRRVTAALPQDLSVTTILRHGDPAEEILKVVREGPFDLICMGARGRGRVVSFGDAVDECPSRHRRCVARGVCGCSRRSSGGGLPVRRSPGTSA